MAKCVDPEIGKLLHAFELQMLSDADRASIGAHLLDCEACLQELRGLSDAAKFLRDSKRISRLFSEATEDGVSRDTISKTIQQWLWSDRPRTISLRAVAIATLLIVGAVSIYHFGSDKSPTQDVHQRLELYSTRGTGDLVVSLGLGSAVELNFVYERAMVEHPYQVEIISSNGDVIYSIYEYAAFNAHGFGSIIVPLDRFAVGHYELVITDRSGAPPANRQQYTFTVEQGESR